RAVAGNGSLWEQISPDRILAVPYDQCSKGVPSWPNRKACFITDVRDYLVWGSSYYDRWDHSVSSESFYGLRFTLRLVGLPETVCVGAQEIDPPRSCLDFRFRPDTRPTARRTQVRGAPI